MIRHTNKKISSEFWEFLPWKKFQINLFRLQKRVWKAVRAGDLLKAKSLQKLILRSQAARFLAIRQVTQLNQGKKTAGIDGKLALTFKERFELEKELKVKTNNWIHKGLREVPIPKKDGTKRILKVPTISDRVWQCLAKYALEPAHEATFHPRSYGFRPGRSAHCAQKHLFDNLNSKRKGHLKRVIELDIKKCFDRISHSTIMENLIAPSKLKLGIFRCLKAGTSIGYPDQGTCQGGVVSPLLANIALNGIEKIGEYKISSGKIISKCVRYADDMIYILKPEDDENQILEKIKQFLAARGMEVSEQKTKLTATTDGFDFLGWNFRVQEKNGKFRSRPSVDNFKAFREKVKDIINSSNYGATEKANKLAPLVRGWRYYHRYCKMDGARNSLYHMQNRAFKVFNREKKQNRYSSKKLLNQGFPTVPYSENKFVNVKGDKSPYDGDLVYWSKRNSKYYDGETSKALKRQNHSCGVCGLKLTSEERVNLHHLDGNHNNNSHDNLVAIHESCHDYTHMSKSKTLRVSGAQCGETCTLRSNREGRKVILSLDSNRQENSQRI